MEDYEKVGYLNTTHKIFYILESKMKEIDLHYHDFNKILILLNGHVDYYIEGKTYPLLPNDIILVSAGKVHRPILSDNSPYERIIIYVSDKFLNSNDVDLFQCFKTQNSEIIRPKVMPSCVSSLVQNLKNELISPKFGSDCYKQAILTELLVHMNRIMLNKNELSTITSTSNQTILNILEYINNHLAENLSINAIANAFFLNRSYLMHLFKSETGYTINSYITNKRLFAAQKLLSDTDNSITSICYQCGFKSYSSFYRAYTLKYNVAPKRAKNINS